MSVLETYEPVRNTVEPEGLAEEDFAADIVAFTTGSVNFARWTITDITGLFLPRDPKAVSVQIKFPANADLGVSDNFATLVSIANRSFIRVNTWRVDANADPSIDFSFSVIIAM
jgi:hypothetical protein